VIDLKLAQKIGAIKAGRLAMIVAAIAGTIPVFLSAEILSATTISGTMVIGLAPPFLLWKMKVPKLSFVLSVIGGIAFGVLLALNLFPNNWNFTEGKYAALLSVNIIGTAVCFLLFLIPKWIKRNG
ncbi:MAG: sodium:solute symporter, partial [Salibacteraceae bacterium]|nr:sodium:solute symporter [Salibacteraceae bacterium]